MTASDSPRSSACFERVLIVRLSSMGDVVHALPAAVLLREAFPHAHIGWLIEERWGELLCAMSTVRSGPLSQQRPLVNAIHTVHLKHWRRTLTSNLTWERIGASLSDLRSHRYQVAVDLQGAARSAILARWSGAPAIFGAARPRENLASMWYTRQVMTERPHVVEQYAEIASAVAGQNHPIPDAIFPSDPAAEEAVVKRLAELALRGVPSIINVGPGEDELAQIAEKASDGAARALSFSVGELIALTRRARLFIGGDTGPMHLAAALHVPIVALFGPTDPARNGPVRTRSIVLRNPASRTSLSHRTEPDPGLLAITSEEVLASANKLLETSRLENSRG